MSVILFFRLEFEIVFSLVYFRFLFLVNVNIIVILVRRNFEGGY